jgi:hypothetical protein
MIRFPADTDGLMTFAGWQLFGHGPTSEVTFGDEREEGGDLVADITVRVDTDAELPGRERKIVTAVAPDGSYGLATVLDGSGELHSRQSRARSRP